MSAPEPGHRARWFKISFNFEHNTQKVHLRRDYFSSTLAGFGTKFSDGLQLFSAFSCVHEHLLALIVKVILGTTCGNNKTSIRIELET